MNFMGGYPFSILLSFIIFLFLTIYTFRFRRSSGSVYFILMMALLSFQALASMLELVANNLEGKLMWRNIQQVPIYYSPVMLLGFIMSFIGSRRRVVIRWLAILSCISLLYWILLITDSHHHLIRVSVWLETYGQTVRLEMEKTHLAFLFLTYHHLVGLWGLSLLLINIRKVVGIQRMQHILLIMAILSPYVLTAVGDIIGWKVYVSVSMLPTGILLFYSLFIYKFLQVRPMAREKVLEHMTEGILIVDEQDLIIDANPAARPIVEHLWGRARLDGTYLLPYLKAHSGLQALYKAKEQGETEVESGGRQFAVRLIPIQILHKRTGSLLIFTDITERRIYENQLIQRATTDGLTKLYNRQHFLELLEYRMKQCQLAGESISLLLLDLDDFKKINDSFGHQAGDHVLRQFAGLLSEVIGEKGFSGRVGGEEFAIVLPDTHGREACEIAERLRLRVQQEPLRSAELALADDIAYTISIGVVELIDPNMTLEVWYQLADTCLYASKNNGRNQTTLAE